MFEKFTPEARTVMSLARQEAQRLNSAVIDTEHILLALIQEGGAATRILSELVDDPARIRDEVEKVIVPSAAPPVMSAQLPFAPAARHVIEFAGEAAGHMCDDAIGTEHLLLGLLAEREGRGAQALQNAGLTLDDTRDMVVRLVADSIEKRNPPFTRQGVRDLIAQALEDVRREYLSPPAHGGDKLRPGQLWDAVAEVHGRLRVRIKAGLRGGG